MRTVLQTARPASTPANEMPQVRDPARHLRATWRSVLDPARHRRAISRSVLLTARPASSRARTDRPFDRTPVRAHDATVNPQRGLRSSDAKTRSRSPAADHRRSGPNPAVTSVTLSAAQAAQPAAVREEGNRTDNRAYTYHHCVPGGTRQLHAPHASAHHAVEPAVLPHERLRQLPRRRSDERRRHLPHLRLHAPPALTA